jgi:predicted nucleic acid-binding protein
VKFSSVSKGFRRDGRRADLEIKVANVLNALPCEPVTCEAAARYAVGKTSQQRRGLSLDENDLWIAASAIALGATVVSYDRDFQSIENLTIVFPMLLT